ncbi:aminodeoxychorismate synthase component I [Candidatus Rariloculus sp.]|uniref:aminodeoxychorismate synthase component I n=1 Tax=Candidatus Rariloculus sp. TaxID=3101265 RepID=UPI003D0C7DD8
MLKVTELQYVADSAARLEALSDRPGCAFLDSGTASDRSGNARYDILSADPYLTLTTRGAVTTIRSRRTETQSLDDPLSLLRQQLGERQDAPPDLPFCGGALGYFGYDLGRRFEELPSGAEADIDMPELAVGLYDWAVVVDHFERRAWLVGQGRDERTFAEWDGLVDSLEQPRPRPGTPFEVLSPVVSNFDRQTYERAFGRIKAHIRSGDCYQVNLTQRFEAKARGNAWQAYLKLRRINPAPFSAYLDHPDGRILCSSPERFLKLRGDRVETKPIKGTRPRSVHGARDRAFAAELRNSDKDRAENVMIVDLLRNDLGRSCVPGSIRATRLFDVESFASVHHLVSTVTGRLAEDRHAVDLLRGCFPGGSITGAPKVRAMQIIDSVEPHRRSIYCGAIGYIGFDGNMDTNIAIRSLVQHRDSIYAWAGGGIVADSEPEAEFQESLDKAAALLAVLDRPGSRRAG